MFNDSVHDISHNLALLYIGPMVYNVIQCSNFALEISLFLAFIKHSAL